MEEKYRIFTKGFDKILDLVEMVDEDTAKNYKMIVNMVPNNVLDAVSESTDFETGCDQYSVDFMRFENAVCLDFIRNNKYLRAEIYIHRIHDEDFAPKKIFSLTVRNTKLKKESIKLFYEEKNGKLNFVGTNDKPNEKNVEISWQVYLDFIDFEPYLVVKKLFRGVEIKSKEVPITFDELCEYFETEEKCGDDWEVEFDADFEV